MMPALKTQRRGWVDLITNANDDITIAHEIITDTHTYIHMREGVTIKKKKQNK